MEFRPTFSFFGQNIGPNCKITITPPEGFVLHLTSITMISSGHLPNEVKTPGHVSISLITSGKSAALCALKENICENLPLDLFFPSQVPLTILNKGTRLVSLVGYYQPLDLELNPPRRASKLLECADIDFNAAKKLIEEDAPLSESKEKVVEFHKQERSAFSPIGSPMENGHNELASDNSRTDLSFN